MREKMLAISRRIRTAAKGFAKNTQAEPVMLAIADIIDEELEAPTHDAPVGSEKFEHCKAVHHRLHVNLDELLACYIRETGKLPTKSSLKEFMEWSHGMTTNPTCAREPNGSG